MKKLLYIFALFIAYNTSAQTVPSSCTATPAIEALYSDDADYIALKRIIALNDKHKDSIHIPQVWADTALRAMIAVYNATALPARDTVVARFNIHEHAADVLHYIFINADSSAYFMEQIQAKVNPTGDPTFDALAALYPINDVSYIPFGSAPNVHQVGLELVDAYNTPILKDEYLALPGVVSTMGTLNLFGDSNHIEYDVTPNHVALRYIRGWEDCPNGCLKRRTWTFHVAWNCDVTYVGSHGDPINPNSVNDPARLTLAVYPNPANNVLYVRGLKSRQTYTITNVHGATIQNGETGSEIDITMLPAGQYFLQLRTADGISNARFIKK